MKEIARSQDFCGGAMLIAIGLAACAIARGYPLGTALRMGPGYFPMLLGGLLALFGLHLVLRSLRATGERIAGGWSLRALVIIPLSFVLFGLLIDRAGFVPAVAVLVAGSAAAGREFRLAEAAALALALTALCVAVFVLGLGLPYPLIAGY
jgi:hypothetical protein